jgi:hypothetical protein
MKIKYTWDPDGVTVLKEPQDTKSDKKQYKFKILVGNNQLVLLHSEKLYSYYKWSCKIEPNEQEWSEKDLQDFISKQSVEVKDEGNLKKGLRRKSGWKDKHFGLLFENVLPKKGGKRLEVTLNVTEMKNMSVASLI